MELLQKLSDILEEDLTENTVLDKLDSYDSLSILSIVAMADKEYGVTIKATDFLDVRTPKDIENLINSKK